MKLIVLAGAKKDAAVPLKKERFVIGRAKECSLRAGSDAISRRHCEIVRGPEGILVRDLGSRNGTHVNDIKIDKETPLNHGDRLRVGPLEFRFEAEGQLNDVKQPKVENAAEAVARTADKAQGASPGHNIEESISDWLLEEPAGMSQAIRETQSFALDETRALSGGLVAPESEPEDAAADDDGDTKDSATEQEAVEEAGGKKKKKEPGKLPKGAFAKPQAKDSTEAAAQILRDMARRR